MPTKLMIQRVAFSLAALFLCFVVLPACTSGIDTSITESIPDGFDPNPNPAPTPTPPGDPTLVINGPVVTPEQPAGFISGTVAVSATATGPTIALVEFFANGVSIGTDNTAPYSINFDTSTIVGSAVAIKAKAIAGSGDFAETPEHNFTIDNTPAVLQSFTALSGNAQDPPGTVSGNVKLAVDADDATGIARVDITLDGIAPPLCSITTPDFTSGNYECFWDSNLEQNGPHTLVATVYDVTATGNPVSFAPLNLFVSNGGATITIAHPVDGAHVSGTIQVSATATDTSGVVSLTFISPAGLVDTDPAADSFVASLDTTTLPDGPLVLTAQALNGNGKLSFKTVTPIVDNIVFDGALSILPPNFNGGDFGAAVAMLGDTNGDNFDDIVLGSPNADYLNINDGLAVVFLGPTFTTTIVIPNPEPTFGALFGSSVTAVGDLNGDGNADLAIGAPGAQVGGLSNSGKVYIFYGPSFTAASATIVANPNSQNGEQFGYAIAGNGDANGDGSKDLIVAAPRYTGSGTFDAKIGRVYLVRGPAFTNFTLISNPDPQFDGRFGETVAMIGDSNSDGKDDFAIGAPNYDISAPSLQNSGRAYVYRGPSTLHVTLDDPSPEFSGHFGSSLSSAGDLNGDGKKDLLIGVSGANANKGQAFYALAPGFSLSSSITRPGGQAGDLFGSSVAGLGDIDGDGHADFAVGAQNADDVTIFFGTAFTTKLTLHHPSGQTGIDFGVSMSGGGDVNNDGLGDVVVGASGLSPTGGASVHFNH